MSQPVYLIDASIYIFRAYFSMPDRWQSPDGYSVNALYGYVQFWLKFLNQSQPNYIAAAYDESLGSCFRNEIYPDYKASRAMPDEELAFQLSACKAFTHILGIRSLASERYEADDLIATLARISRSRKKSVCVVSRDKDLGQLLVDENDCWWDFAADKQIKKHDFVAHFGVLPEQVIDYLSLVGDSIDDIPGVPGIGKKTAATLLAQFGSIEKIYHNLDAVIEGGVRGAKGIVVRLKEYENQVKMAQNLVRLHDQIDLSESFDDLQWQVSTMDGVKCFLEEFGLGGRFDRQLSECYWWK